MDGLQVSIRNSHPQKDVATIQVAGHIDTTTVDELEWKLDSVLNSSCHNLVVDLNNVDYVSSTGWCLFLKEVERIRDNGGDLKLARLQSDVSDVFNLLELNFFLHAYESIEDAASDFKPGPSSAMAAYLV